MLAASPVTAGGGCICDGCVEPAARQYMKLRLMCQLGAITKGDAQRGARHRLPGQMLYRPNDTDARLPLNERRDPLIET